MIRFISIISFAFLINYSFSSCSSKKSNSEIWDSCTERKLDMLHATILLPEEFKRTSKYKLVNDIPLLNENLDLQDQVLKFLNAFEFKDSSLDAFYAANKELNLVTILNDKRVEFDSKLGNQLKAIINAYYKNLEIENSLSVISIDNYIKNTDKLQMMKFKHRFENKVHGNSYFQSIFFVNTQAQLFVVKQISLEESDVEDYLWSLKD